jgi:glycosyltransferase involved in cell wall biosynthesis
MNSPLISIITVVYNSETLIRGTIDSILAQTCQNVELIIVDGASTDNTLNIIKSYGNQIAKCISEPDRGIYDAMNKGLDLATGEYVWFINSGDKVYSNDVVEKIENIYTTNNPDVFYGETMLIDENGSKLGTRSTQTTRKLPENLTSKSMINGMVVSHQSFIPKTALVDKYDLIYQCSSDLDWVIRCLNRSKAVVNTGIILSSYLVGGYSSKKQKVSWKERWNIYIKYFGTVSTLLAHMRIVERNVLHLITGKKNY